MKTQHPVLRWNDWKILILGPDFAHKDIWQLCSLLRRCSEVHSGRMHSSGSWKMLAKSVPFLSLDKDKLQFPSKEGSSSVCFEKTKQSTNFLGFASILIADGSRCGKPSRMKSVWVLWAFLAVMQQSFGLPASEVGFMTFLHIFQQGKVTTFKPKPKPSPPPPNNMWHVFVGNLSEGRMRLFFCHS